MSFTERIRRIEEENDPLSPSDASVSLARIPRTVAIARMVLEERVAELDVDAGDLTVVVNGFGYDVAEIDVWLSLGVGHVIAVDPNPRSHEVFEMKIARYHRWLQANGHQLPRITILRELSRAIKGDIVTWVYPTQLPGILGRAEPITPELLTRALADGGWLIIVTDRAHAHVAPLLREDSRYELRHIENGVTREAPIFPSPYTTSIEGGTLAIIRDRNLP